MGERGEKKKANNKTNPSANYTCASERDSFTSGLESHLRLTKAETSPRLSVSKGIQTLFPAAAFAQLLCSLNGSGEQKYSHPQPKCHREFCSKAGFGASIRVPKPREMVAAVRVCLQISAPRVNRPWTVTVTL